MSIKILVVDDSASERLIIKDMLCDYDVFIACDGAEAMHMLESIDGINLLILDINMPNMNGFQVLESIKKDERFKELRTIILTDYGEIDNETKGIELGAVDYIRRPINKGSLKARIDVHIELLRYKQMLDEQLFTFDMIFEQAPIGIVISQSNDLKSYDRKFLRVNSMLEQITGRTKEELISLSWVNITHPDDIEADLEQFKRLHAGEIKSYSMDKRYIKPDGSIVWVHMIVAPLALPNGLQFNHICLVQDITDRKMMEKALNESERSKTVFLSHLPGLAYRCNYDHEWTMQYVSKGCFNLTGYPPESLLYNRDLSYNDIISPEYRYVLWNEWKRILAAKQPFKYEYEIITATGEKKWVLELGQGVYNERGEVEALEGIVLDISDRKAIEDALKYSNEHDRWTGLYNREYLESLFKNDAVLKGESKKALVGVNLSTVQLITANYGFQYTQNLIKKAAEALSRYCTDKRILFNTYHNRFVFLFLDYKDKNELVEFAQSVADTLESLFLMERIGGGIGVLEIDPDNELDLDLLSRNLLVASERAMSFIGKDFNICFYNEDLEALVNRETDIVEALNTVATDDSANDNLFLQYQPIVNLETGEICAFEALARLRTDKLGLVSPGEFIAIAEKTKQIIPIGEKVIISAFSFLNKLKEHGYDDIDVSINISVIQMLNPNFVSRLFELIDDMQVNTKRVCIEITESIFANDFKTVNNVIEKLKEAGLHLAIDDFGKGYSSLAREKELKVDYLKIDKHFIDQLINTDHNRAIISDIISMSHKLGHRIIAEGVEHVSQCRYLREHNCDRIQGYLISKPLDETDAFELLKGGKQNVGCPAAKDCLCL